MQYLESKYGRQDTPSKVRKRWEESQKDIVLANSVEASERLIALQKFKELFAQQKHQITLKSLKDPYY